MWDIIRRMKLLVNMDFMKNYTLFGLALLID